MRKDAPPRIFDRRQLRRRRLRGGIIAPDGGFLGALGAKRLAERLADIQRDWNRVLVNGPGAADSVQANKMFACDLADSRMPEARAHRVVGDEEAPPFADETFDLILSNLTLQGTNDLPGALFQFRRMLVPDGLLLAVLFGGETLCELYHSLFAAEAQQSDQPPRRIAPFAEVRDLGDLLQRAGFALPVADLDRVQIRYPTLRALVHDIRALGESNALSDRDTAPIDRETLSLAERIYRGRFPDGNGICATFDLVFLSGWSPHPDQPKPLRPGSAKKSLAAALKKAESNGAR